LTVFNFKSHCQDGGHDIILHRQVLPPGECKQSVNSMPMQQCPPVPDLYYICTCFKNSPKAIKQPECCMNVHLWHCSPDPH